MSPLVHFLMHAIPCFMLTAALNAYYLSPVLLPANQVPDAHSDEIENRLKLFVQKHQFPVKERYPGESNIEEKYPGDLPNPPIPDPTADDPPNSNIAEKYPGDLPNPPIPDPTVDDPPNSNIAEKYPGDLPNPPVPDPTVDDPSNSVSDSERFTEDSSDEHAKYPGMKVLPNDPALKFKWENCGSLSDPIDITKVEVSPFPVPLNGDVFFNLHLNFKEDLVGPLTLDSETQKLAFGTWSDVDCQGYWGTCHYEDICPMLNKMATCPPQLLRKIPCKCPFKQGTYKVDNSKFMNQLPKYAAGQYRSTLRLSRNGVRLGCYKFTYKVA